MAHAAASSCIQTVRHLINMCWDYNGTDASPSMPVNHTDACLHLAPQNSPASSASAYAHPTAGITRLTGNRMLPTPEARATMHKQRFPDILSAQQLQGLQQLPQSDARSEPRRRRWASLQTATAARQQRHLKAANHTLCRHHSVTVPTQHCTNILTALCLQGLRQQLQSVVRSWPVGKAPHQQTAPGCC